MATGCGGDDGDCGVDGLRGDRRMAGGCSPRTRRGPRPSGGLAGHGDHLRSGGAGRGDARVTGFDYTGLG